MKYLAQTIGVIGLVGILATIFGLEERLRTVFLLTFGGMLVVGILAGVTQCLSITALWRVLPACRRLGIVGIYVPSLPEKRLRRRLRKATEIAVIAVSAQHFAKRYKEEIVRALAKKRARIRVLLTNPESSFLQEVEQMEGEPRHGHIQPEVLQTKDLLVEYVKEARKLVGKTRQIGSVELGFYSTEFRVSLVLCDRAWGQLTHSLPPKRDVSTNSFELKRAKDGLLQDCLSHFDRVWTRADARGRVQLL